MHGMVRTCRHGEISPRTHLDGTMLGMYGHTHAQAFFGKYRQSYAHEILLIEGSQTK
jgi:hypothetical protein